MFYLIINKDFIVVMNNSNQKMVRETRPCGECKHFQDPMFEVPICRKFKENVTKDKKIMYLAEQGTCFESK